MNKNFIMKKVIRLTESDLIRIIKRVINEQPSENNTMIEDIENFCKKKGFPEADLKMRCQKSSCVKITEKKFTKNSILISYKVDGTHAEVCIESDDDQPHSPCKDFFSNSWKENKERFEKYVEEHMN